MMDFMAQVFPHTLFALVVVMVIFLVGKGWVSTIALYSSLIAISAGMVSIYAYVLTVGGLGAPLVFFVYAVPITYMLNFALYATVFNSITESLKGKLKLCTAVFLILFSLSLYAAFIEREIFAWIERRFAFANAELIFAFIFWVPAVLWILGTLITHWVMFIYSIKTAEGQRAKMIWAIVAFVFPILGSLLYIFIRLIKVLFRLNASQGGESK